MPERPEDQTIVDDLNAAGLIGAVMTGARVFWRPSVSGCSNAVFSNTLKNQTVTSIRRRGKHIVFELSGPRTLLSHLRMSGRLHLTSVDIPRAKHEHVIIKLTKQRELRLHDTRKFARVELVDDPEPILNRLGPEPLDPSFTARALAGILLSRKRMIKPLLLDQAMIAGLGNIYTDEALWDAGINSCRISTSLSETEIESLRRAIRKVLKQGLKNLGTSMGSGRNNFALIGQNRGYNRECLKVYHRASSPCPRWPTKIKRIIVGQRGTHICPKCQLMLRQN
jgi:formamidopyrimidine-DNA glycosylase